MARWATAHDRGQIYDLWAMRFGDSADFMDWFFKNRWAPRYTAVSESGGKIVSSIQSWPVHLRIRGKTVPCCIVSGVSTHSDYERRGYMGEAMRFLMNGLAERGIGAVICHPVDMAIYTPFGHYPVTDAQIAGISDISALPEGEAIFKSDIVSIESEIYECYSGFIKSYSCAVSRTMADMRLKLADYASDGGQYAATLHNGEVTAYCVYHDGDIISSDEFAFTSVPDANHLAGVMAGKALSKGKEIELKLPSDMNIPGFSGKIVPQAALGLADASTFIRGLGLCGKETIEVRDRIVNANNMTVDMCGNETHGPGDIVMDAGRLGQLLCGYRTLGRLADGNNVFIRNPGAARSISDKLRKEKCFIIDEY